jgi:hypothetical protein
MAVLKLNERRCETGGDDMRPGTEAMAVGKAAVLIRAEPRGMPYNIGLALNTTRSRRSVSGSWFAVIPAL